MQSLVSWVRSNKERLEKDPALAAKAQALIDQLVAYRIELKEARASDKQLAFQEDFFARRHRTYAALGGNRSGKSIVAGVMCFAKWIRDVAADGDVYWCSAPTSEKSLGQQKLLWETLPRWMFGKFSFDNKNGFDGQRPIVTMQLPNDRGRCVINFKNSEQSASTYEQDAINGVWADEALPYEYFQRLIPRCIDRRGWILYSDIPEQDWHYLELFNAPKEALVYCQVFAMHDNAANLPEGEIELASARMSDDERQMRIFGKFRRLSGVVFREYDRSRHRIPPFKIPSVGPYPSETNWPRWRMLDYGGSSPTACSWLTIAPNERAYVYREYYQRYGNVKSHAAAIKEMSIGVDGKPEQYVQNFLDPHAWDTSPANDLNIAAQYALEGLEFHPWPYMNVFGERAAVEILKRRFEVDQLMVFNHCIELDRELGRWKYNLDKNGNPVAGDTYEKANNHLIDGIKGLFATRPAFAISEIRRRR
jgi:hypothetical protein